MSQQRLPLPNEVVEHCKLCAAALEISVNNPRRVCAQCGEVNLPNDAPAPRSLRLGVPSLRGGLSASSRKKWLAHGVALSLQLPLVLLAAWRLGAGGKFDLGLVFVGVAFLYFAGYAAVVSVPVVFLRTARQVVLFDCVVPLTLLALWLAAFVPRASSAPGRPVPAATPKPTRAPAPPQPLAPPPKPRAPAAPGWEQSSMLASFSVAEEGTAFKLRFVPHFTGRLEVRAGHPQLLDMTYGSTTCEARAEEPAECVLVLSRPQRPSGVGFELSAVLHDGSRAPFGGQVTAVRVDASGAGRPSR